MPGKSLLARLFGKKGAPLFLKGIELFNSGDHWEAHEIFEDVWRLQDGDAKKLAQGFVQMAAAFSYIKKKRYESIRYLFDKSSEKFTETAHLFPDANIPALVEAMAFAKGEVERLGEEGLDKFPSSLYPHIVLAPRKGGRRSKRS